VDPIIEHDFERLAELGWKPAQLQDVTLEELEGCVIGRVTSVERDRFGIAAEHGSCTGLLPGRLRGTIDDTSPPTVGDWVLLDGRDQRSERPIRRVLVRTSVLERTAPGQEGRASAERQTLCANVDTALVVAALDDSLNLRRVERYVTLARTGGVHPVVVLSKADRCDAADAERDRCAARLAPTDVVALDARDETARERLEPWLLAGDTLVLLGPSGVGKSTLANTLAGEPLQVTGAVREGDAKGRHTTTRRSLFRLPVGLCLIDTPGLRELALAVDETALEESFADIAALARGCRFGDCSHGGEPGCAVALAREAGTLAPGRWEGYLRLAEEARTRERRTEGVHQRRDRARAFGKQVKEAKSRKSRSRGD